MSEVLHEWVKNINNPLWDYLVILLLVVGIFFSVATGLVQLRLLPRSVREMLGGRNAGGNNQAITPFQAFVTGLASRVGVGNIAGVAIAIAAGGPGAVFWMWVTALLGMSSAFVESSLAQLFKVRDGNTGKYRGGPAYYITQGLKQRWLGILFALTLILAFGFVFNSVQANSIIAATEEAWGWNKYIVGGALVVITAPIIFGGIKRVARIAEVMVPLMAVLYLLVALYIILMNASQLPVVFSTIVTEAFNFHSMVGGIFGAMFSQAMMLGIKRGLFSNEAGMGSAPNAAAAAEVKHPVSQGMIQMLGVFVDTMVVCTSTAAIILLSGVDYSGQNLSGIVLTQTALEMQMGGFGANFLAVVLFLFAFSTIIGNYAYAESNVQFIHNNPKVLLVFRGLVLAMVYFGAIEKAPLVWDMADLSMGLMAVINLVAIVLLSPIAFLLLRDYQKQVKAKQVPVFKLTDYPELAKKVQSDIWK